LGNSISKSPLHQKRRKTWKTYWNKEVGHFLLVALPGFAVFPATSSNVSASSVDDHDHEEDEVEPRERAPEVAHEVSNPSYSLWLFFFSLLLFLAI
jgi:hypothetical protein